ncbi:MAG: hypothetical protein AB8B86_18725 [Pseudomonadales bacterium]
MTTATETQEDTQERGVASLRSLLSSPDPFFVDSLEQRLLELEAARTDKELRTREVAEVIADAISERSEKDAQLGDALRPLVETQFHTAARENVDMMADALFPVLGPAVRKLVADMISPSEDGKAYHIEQLFLIDNPTGLPIAHVYELDIQIQDADMVSGMLSAIKSYVNDAFSANEFDGLDQIRVGELAIWIEWGPHAVLAAVIRGTGPDKLRVSMQQALESIHKNFDDVIREYEGVVPDREGLEAPLRNLLASEQAPKKRGISRRTKFIASSILLLTLAAVYAGYSIYDSQRWNKYTNALSKQSGLMIIQSDRGLSGYKVSGLRDPLSSDPRKMLEGTTIDPQRVHFEWSPVVSLAPSIVIKRVTRALEAPQGIELLMRDTTLVIKGFASSEWYAEAKRRALIIPGVEWVHAPDTRLY